MAIVKTAVVNRPTYKSWTFTALDADTTLAFAHGFGAIPDEIVLTPLVSYASTALPTWGVAVDATNITLTKTTATGSGGTTPGTTVILKLTAKLPHSIL